MGQTASFAQMPQLQGKKALRPDQLLTSGGRVLLLADGERYEGDYNDSLRPHGQGSHFASDGFELACGPWVDGVLHGRAVVYQRQGSQCEGEFDAGRLIGAVKVSRLDGSVFQGEVDPAAGTLSGFGILWTKDSKLPQCGRWANNKLVQSAPVPRAYIIDDIFLSEAVRSVPMERTLLLDDGGHYVGDFNADFLPHGVGTKYRVDGSACASGQWRDGLLFGHGQQAYPSGDVYGGSFVDGRRHGLGRYTYADGSVFEGEFVMGVCSGHGMQWDAEGVLTHCGRWLNDDLAESCAVPRTKVPYGALLSIQARSVPPDRTLLLPSGGFYVGRSVNLQPHGQGTLYRADGSEAVRGDWNAGKLLVSGFRDAAGLLQSGAVEWDLDGCYEGTYQNGVRVGLARQTWLCGGVYEGEWADDKPSGLAMVWTGDGVLQFCGRWERDEPIESRPVPRNKIPYGAMLNDEARFASPEHTLLLPCGGHYTGGFDSSNRPHGQGVLYRPDGTKEVAGVWTHGRLQLSGARDAEGRVHGVGSEWDGGSRYDGAFEHGRRHGLGVLWSHGCVNVKYGRWVHDELMEPMPLAPGRFPPGHKLDAAAMAADLVLPCGGYYIGQVNEQGLQHGSGTEHRADGSKLSSDHWRQGRLDGKGVDIWPGGGRYEGDFAGGVANGVGRLTREGGRSTYLGQWADDKQHGRGREVCPTGRYEGEFLAGKRHGRGCEWHPCGTLVYDGTWFAGQRQGVGRWTSPNGVWIYEGQFARGMKHGLGVCWRRNGMRQDDLVGLFVDDGLDQTVPVPRSKLPPDSQHPAAAQGASLIYRSGCFYVGSLNAHLQRHGPGSMHAPDGSVSHTGMWRNDVLKGDHQCVIC